MTNLLRTGAAYLAATMKASVSDTITYRRGGASVSLSATRGRTEFQAVNGDGTVIEVVSADWIVDPDDLILNGAETLPRKGDTITDDVATYQVMPPQGSDKAYRQDATKQRLRIHTKQVGT